MVMTLNSLGDYHRRMKHSTRGSLLAVLLLALPAVAWRVSQDFSSVQLEVTPVAGQVHVLKGAGGNIGLSVGDDGVLMIDDQFGPLADRIAAQLDELAGAQPSYLLNTHWHGDHTGGNEHFGAHAVVVAHHNVRRRLAGDAELEGRVNEPPLAKPGLPVVTFDEGLSLHFNGEEVRVIHLPHGHTDGDSIVWFTGSNVAHLGDHYFAGAFPYVDLTSGGDVEGFIANLDRIRELLPEDVTLIPGHGSVGGWEAFDEYRAMVGECASRVRAALAEGKSGAAMIEEGLLADLDERWGQGFMNAAGVTEIFARSLAK
jgi:cyclase